MNPEEQPDEAVVDVDGLDSGEDDVPPVLTMEEPQTWEEMGVMSPQMTSLHMQAVIDNVAKGQPIEFRFVDDANVLCPLCDDLVAFQSLFTSHLPDNHPGEYCVVDEGASRLAPVDVAQAQKLIAAEELMLLSRQTLWEAEIGQYSLRSTFSEWPHHSEATEEIEISSTPLAPPEKKSRSRVSLHTASMNLDELTEALQTCVAEKLGETFPVTLVDRTHARCGICYAIVSLNSKFETANFIRHVNAWHALLHKCAGTWLRQERTPPKSTTEELAGEAGDVEKIRRLSIFDLSSTDYSGLSEPNEASLQCIRCGMFLSDSTVGLHFSEMHSKSVKVPECHYCIKEIVLNARYWHRYEKHLELTLPDCHRIYCGVFKMAFDSERALMLAIEQELMRSGELIAILNESDGKLDEIEEESCKRVRKSIERKKQAVATDLSLAKVFNSEMPLDRNKKPRRRFLQPAFLQAAPVGSELVAEVGESHWKCLICGEGILAAVTSSGAIRHFRSQHPELLKQLQREICYARLQRMSSGNVTVVSDSQVVCLLCQKVIPLHVPFNICRALHHFRRKHLHFMPKCAPQEEVDRIQLEELQRELGVTIGDVRTVMDAHGHPVTMLLPKGADDLDIAAACRLASSLPMESFE
uniref:C2H2-type domain-containing protein n=1 Tax=Plectus sambesii TaxID=2011161 RepID=A0A914XNR6_9BILA